MKSFLSIARNLVVACWVIASWYAQVSAQELTAEQRRQAVAEWEDDIEALEAKNKTELGDEDSILLIGSSSIRLWETVAEDLAPYRTIARGYGGAKFSDVAFYARRLIQPHQFRALIVFVANDVTGGEKDASLAEIEGWVQHILSVAREHQPNAEIFLIEVTPTEKRWSAWPRIREVNALLRELSLTTPNTHFIPTAEYYLTDDRQPRPEYFGDDQLHLNREGYRRWGKIIRHHLDAELKEESVTN